MEREARLFAALFRSGEGDLRVTADCDRADRSKKKPAKTGAENDQDPTNDQSALRIDRSDAQRLTARARDRARDPQDGRRRIRPDLEGHECRLQARAVHQGCRMNTKGAAGAAPLTSGW